MQLAALAAEELHMSLFAYVEHLRHIGERYGDDAARLDLLFAVEVRQARAELAKKAQG